MALYQPDYKLSDAKKAIDELDPKNKKNELILYFIKNKDVRIKELETQLDEYRKFFKTMSKFLPSHSPTVYR